MPLGEFESQVLRVLAANRHPDSFLAGATVLHQAPDSPRASRDLDLFHDTVESLAASYRKDLDTLAEAGFAVAPVGQPQPTFLRAYVLRDGRKTKVEWVFDSAFRFFPIEPDAELGWRLNFWDAATNKVLALFGRQVVRDYLDCHYLHEHHLHLGALIWAAAGKDGGLTPELIVDWARRTTKYRIEDVEELKMNQPVDLRALKVRWMTATEEAEALFKKLPPAEMGCLYLDSTGRPVCPDPEAVEFAGLTRHFGSVRGAWPRIVEE